MNKNFVIKSIIVIILFSIAIYEENRVISFIFFTLPWFIILYSIFISKKNSNNQESISKDDVKIEQLAKEIHKKFHIICDILEKIKKFKSKDDLILELEKKGIVIDKDDSNRRQIRLDFGNNWIYSNITNAEHSLTDYQKYEFYVIGIEDYTHLNLSYNYQDKKRRVSCVDLVKEMKLDKNKHDATGKHSNKLYKLILKMGGFNNTYNN
jgi:hypothetical protein